MSTVSKQRKPKRPAAEMMGDTLFVRDGASDRVERKPPPTWLKEGDAGMRPLNEDRPKEGEWTRIRGVEVEIGGRWHSVVTDRRSYRVGKGRRTETLFDVLSEMLKDTAWETRIKP